MRKHVKEYLEAVSQSFFLENPWFGALLLLLFLAFNPIFFACGFSASLFGYVVSTRPRTPHAIRASGLMTINGLFFGVAMAGLFRPSPALALSLVVGAAMIPLVTQAAHELLQHWKLSPYILPYILATWVVWLCAGGLALELHRESWPMTFIELPAAQPDWHIQARIAWAALESMGRLFFLPSAAFGLALLSLILSFSVRRGVFFLVGTLVATVTAGLLSGGGHAWEHGFFSYSAGLIGLGLASFEERIGTRRILLFCVASAFLTLAVDELARGLEIPELSTPYVLTMWLAILSRGSRVSLAWEPGRSSRREAMPLVAPPPIAVPQPTLAPVVADNARPDDPARVA